MLIDDRLENPDAPAWDTPEGRAVTFFLNPNPKDMQSCIRCGQPGKVGKGKGSELSGLPFCSANCRTYFADDFRFIKGQKCTLATAVAVLSRLLS